MNRLTKYVRLTSGPGGILVTLLADVFVESVMPSLTPAAPTWDVRAPTVLPLMLSAEERRSQFAAWVSNTITGPVAGPYVLSVDLDARDRDLGVVELDELVIQLGAQLKARRFGEFLLVVTTHDPSMREVVRALAASHEVPIYLAPSPYELDQAVPAMDLTPLQGSVLQVVGQVGWATTSVVAQALGSHQATISNVLANLASAGLLLRTEGSGRIGHAYGHPIAATAVATDEPLRTTVTIPDALNDEIAAIARLAGQDPGQMLTVAWQEFLDRHHDLMAATYSNMARLMKENDRAGLIELVTRSAAAHARATAPSDET